MLTYAPANSTFDGPVTNLLSVLCVLIEILSRADAKGEKGLNGFKFGTFVGRSVQSDGAALSTAVKGLTCNSCAERTEQGYINILFTT